MVAHYFDSSAMMKRYVAEAGSDWVDAMLGQADAVRYTAVTSGVEIVCGLARRLTSTQAKTLTRTFTDEFTQLYHPIQITGGLVQSAMDLGAKHRLRGYDAIQLAAAASVAAEYEDIPLTFISADRELCSAAMAEGLAVENPNDHA